MNIPGTRIPSTYFFIIPIFNAFTGVLNTMIVEAITAQDAYVSCCIYLERICPEWFIDPRRDWALDFDLEAGALLDHDIEDDIPYYPDDYDFDGDPSFDAVPF